MTEQRTPSGRFYRWDYIIKRAQAIPNVWLPLLPDSPSSVVTTIGLRKHPALRREDGVLEASLRNEYRDDRGKRRANVDVRWVPKVIVPGGDQHTEE